MSSLNQTFQDIIHSTEPTEASSTYGEIIENRKIIEEHQLNELLQLHDKTFQDKCIQPINKLKEKYDKLLQQDNDIQTHVAMTDRDLRIIELTLDLVYRNKNIK